MYLLSYLLTLLVGKLSLQPLSLKEWHERLKAEIQISWPVLKRGLKITLFPRLVKQRACNFWEKKLTFCLLNIVKLEISNISSPCLQILYEFVGKQIANKSCFISYWNLCPAWTDKTNFFSSSVFSCQGFSDFRKSLPHIQSWTAHVP